MSNFPSPHLCFTPTLLNGQIVIQCEGHTQKACDGPHLDEKRLHGTGGIIPHATINVVSGRGGQGGECHGERPNGVKDTDGAENLSVERRK